MKQIVAIDSCRCEVTGRKIGIDEAMELSERLKTNTTVTSLNLYGEEEEGKEKEKREKKNE